MWVGSLQVTEVKQHLYSTITCDKTGTSYLNTIECAKLVAFLSHIIAATGTSLPSTHALMILKYILTHSHTTPFDAPGKQAF